MGGFVAGSDFTLNPARYISTRGGYLAVRVLPGGILSIWAQTRGDVSALNYPLNLRIGAKSYTVVLNRIYNKGAFPLTLPTKVLSEIGQDTVVWAELSGLPTSPNYDYFVIATLGERELLVERDSHRKYRFLIHAIPEAIGNQAISAQVYMVDARRTAIYLNARSALLKKAADYRQELLRPGVGDSRKAEIHAELEKLHKQVRDITEIIKGLSVKVAEPATMALEFQ